MAGPGEESRSFKTLTIANGAAISDALDISNRTLVGVITPSAWTAAAISFTVSMDGTTYYPLYKGDAEVTIATGQISATEARAFRLDPVDFAGWKYVKVQSGINGTTVNQGAARSVIAVARPV